MPAIETQKVEGKSSSRDGRQWLKDTEFCESVEHALKESFTEDNTRLSTTVAGVSEARKVRGALRYFADKNGWGLSLSTKSDEDSDTHVITFKAQEKRPAPKATGPRKVRRRKDEADEDYEARVKSEYPRDAKGGERPAEYKARLAILMGTAE